MLNALADFFTPEAGQARRQWLNDQEQRVGNALAYYLGPAAQPIQSAAMLAGYMTPGADMMEAADASRGMWNADNPLDAAVAGATMLGATGMMFLPGNYNALREGIGSVADDMVAAYDPSRVNSIIAYHGSPHTFDRFDISKIGTGEGAQAYGHGLYFAENEGIAQHYRDTLTSGLQSWTVDGVPAARLHGSTNPEDALRLNYAQAVREGRTPDEAIDWLAMQYRGKASSRWEYPENIAYYNEQIARLENMRSSPPVVAHNPGSMYQVQINADPSQLLDWDAPLSAQPQVQSLVPGLDGRGRDAVDRLYNMASDPIHEAYRRGELPLEVYQQSNPNVQVSEMLKDAGIPGIQYLDAGSRAAGDGSRNFVIFDDSIVDILKRYGIGAAAVGGGWALAPEEAQAAQSAGLFDPAANDRQVILDWLDSQGL